MFIFLVWAKQFCKLRGNLPRINFIFDIKRIEVKVDNDVIEGKEGEGI